MTLQVRTFQGDEVPDAVFQLRHTVLVRELGWWSEKTTPADSMRDAWDSVATHMVAYDASDEPVAAARCLHDSRGGVPLDEFTDLASLRLIGPVCDVGRLVARQDARGGLGSGLLFGPILKFALERAAWIVMDTFREENGPRDVFAPLGFLPVGEPYVDPTMEVVGQVQALAALLSEGPWAIALRNPGMASALFGVDRQFKLPDRPERDLVFMGTGGALETLATLPIENRWAIHLIDSRSVSQSDVGPGLFRQGNVGMNRAVAVQGLLRDWGFRNHIETHSVSTVSDTLPSAPTSVLVLDRQLQDGALNGWVEKFDLVIDPVFSAPNVIDIREGRNLALAAETPHDVTRLISTLTKPLPEQTGVT